ncbi:MAG: nucleotidyl transferase AbiEii/AbiGii toxin family protein [Candidatus Eisenbacteria bacterium]|nr:nucleotidyl transferase AbiEii/AbiGii toxin family protein [Candidatus Eisenbacteria bacterium]
MAREVTNIAVSVHQRLLNKARVTGRPFNELLQRFAIERFLYRLSKSRHADRFVLKGALMLPVWGGAASRPTKDIDLLGRIDNNLEYVAQAMSDVCEVDVQEDGMVFDAESVTAARITEEAEYQGVRVRLKAALGNARVSMQVDIGIGDVLFPQPQDVEYPTLLDFPPARLKGYAMESTVAEKFQAMVVLGILNSRMKDFYDIWMLSRTFDFAGEALAEAIEKTFEARQTELTAEATVFEPSFANDTGKQAQWTAFLRKSNLGDAPSSFSEVVEAVTSFLKPVARALVKRKAFRATWKAPGPWR